jgi:hypothetical protein
MTRWVLIVQEAGVRPYKDSIPDQNIIGDESKRLNPAIIPDLREVSDERVVMNFGPFSNQHGLGLPFFPIRHTSFQKKKRPGKLVATHTVFASLPAFPSWWPHVETANFLRPCQKFLIPEKALYTVGN